jgi:L-gulonolactone oxidase
MSAAMFRSGYPALGRFAAHVDPGISSSFWRRVGA